jgi:tRNA(Leu) C34 or U34 (ribose-2'-O)-methylase TrmL
MCSRKAFEAHALPTIDRLYMFSKHANGGSVDLADQIFDPDVSLALVFGSEEKGLKGLPMSTVEGKASFVHLPMQPQIRSYNLSSSVAMGLFEAHRQCIASRATE